MYGRCKFRWEGREMIQEIGLCLFLGYFTYEDIKTRRLSGKGIFLFAIVGGIISVLFPAYRIGQILLGMGIGGGLLIMSLLSKGGIGVGDGIVVLISGIYLGVQENCFLLLLALLVSSLYSGILWIVKKGDRKQKIPFIPFLLVGYIMRLVFGIV